MPTVERIERAVLAVARVQPRIQRDHGQGVCILSTRVAVEALRRCRIQAEPVAVHVELGVGANRLGYTGRPIPEGHHDVHLVALVEDRIVLDLALGGQFGRPDSIALPLAIAFHVAQGFAQGGEASVRTDSATLTYAAHPGDAEPFERHWQRIYRPLADEAEAHVRHALA